MFHDETGEQINFFIQSLVGNCLLGEALRQGKMIFIADTKSNLFNRDVDCPINYKSDRSIKNMNIVHLMLNDIGFLRIYLSS